MTNSDKSIATLGTTDAESFEASLRNLRQRRAAEAPRRLQQEAERRGLDRLKLDEINAEIQAVRRSRESVEEPSL